MPSYQEMGDSPGSGAGDANHSPVSASWGSPASALAAVRSGPGRLSAEPLARECKNQPAGGATPGHPFVPSAPSAPSADSASGRTTSVSWRAAGATIRPDGTDQDGTTRSGQTGATVFACCDSLADPGA
jgi:hypothetical protein